MPRRSSVLNPQTDPPVELKFWWPHTVLKSDPRKHLRFASFVQFMSNRLFVGGLRYGPASKTQRYHERAQAELKAYRRTHNLEHLINMANYAFLEHEAPAFNDAHHAADSPSATRDKFGTGGWVGEHDK